MSRRLYAAMARLSSDSSAAKPLKVSGARLLRPHQHLDRRSGCEEQEKRWRWPSQALQWRRCLARSRREHVEDAGIRATCSQRRQMKEQRVDDAERRQRRANAGARQPTAAAEISSTTSAALVAQKSAQVGGRLSRGGYNYGGAQPDSRTRSHCSARLLRRLRRRTRPGSGRLGGGPTHRRETGGVWRSRAGSGGSVRGSGEGRDRSALSRAWGA